MAVEGNAKCAVGGCNLPISGASNLCSKHRLPGVAARTGNSSMVITIWAVEHEDLAGAIFLNDWALGRHFGGSTGFEERLRRQGFTNVRNIRTPEELELAKRLAAGKKLGIWGPWEPTYPWEVISDEIEAQ